MSEPSRRGRQATIRQLLADECYASQGELSEALARLGIEVSQGTLSKDLQALGAIRRRSASGALVYAPGSEPSTAAAHRLAGLCSELLVSLRSAGNQIVVKTPPGAAQYFGAAIDTAGFGDVMGTIAGDDTVLVIAVDEMAAEAVVTRLSLMTRTGRDIEEDDL
ncbi:MAG: arginine repressor [Arachnia sp.]